MVACEKWCWTQQSGGTSCSRTWELDTAQHLVLHMISTMLMKLKQQLVLFMRMHLDMEMLLVMLMIMHMELDIVNELITNTHPVPQLSICKRCSHIFYSSNAICSIYILLSNAKSELRLTWHTAQKHISKFKRKPKKFIQKKESIMTVTCYKTLSNFAERYPQLLHN